MTTDRASEKAPSELSPGDALRDAGQRLLSLLVQRAAEAATDRVEGLADRLGEAARDGGPGLSALISGGKSLAEGHSPVRAAMSSGLSGLTEKAKGIFGGGGKGGGGKKLKVTNIVEEIDVGLPLRVAYNLWTQFEDFPSFMKKVESVERTGDEKLNWKAQVFWSHRIWEATIIEQVPDSHIVWRSKGAKGHVDGAVSFTELGPNLTRVLLVLEYHPQGFFERTGNLWRAQGRRARLEFKHFRRHAMVNALLNQDEIEGWRGEIRDSEVVRSHEDALREEREGGEKREESEGADGGDRDQDHARPPDEEREGEQDHGEEEDRDREDEDYENEGDEGEDYENEGEEDEAYEDEEEEEEDYDDYDEDAGAEHQDTDAEHDDAEHDEDAPEERRSPTARAGARRRR